MNNLELVTNIRKRYQVYVIIGISLAILGVLLLIFTYKAVFSLFTFFGLIITIISKALFQTQVKRIKPKIINSMLNKYFDEAQYFPNRGLTQLEVQTSELLNKPDRFYSEDYLKGSINGVNFVSSDLHLQEERVSSNGKTTTIEYVTYFFGRFFIIDFNKKFDGKVLVVEEKRSTLFTKYKKIKLESIDFNKTFNTYSLDDYSAFYVLTPHLMEALLELEAKNPGRLYVSFIKDKLSIAIHNNRDTFNIRLFGVNDLSLIKGFEDDLKVIRNIILSLRLDNKIYK